VQEIHHRHVDFQKLSGNGCGLNEMDVANVALLEIEEQDQKNGEEVANEARNLKMKGDFFQTEN